MSRPPTGTTVVAQLTPAGRAAVATLLVAGPEATSAVAGHFRPHRGRPLAELPVGRVVVGRWGDPPGEEVVVTRRSDERIEVHCHGGAAAAGAIVATLRADGCREIAWQESVAADGDPIRGEARRALATARTERTAAIVLAQYEGALRRAIEAAREAARCGALEEAASGVSELLARADLGLHLAGAWRVVLAGEPNVGKSSLINALVGYRRAIVYPTAGTTRDLVTATTAIDGWPVELADTAGLRATEDPLERAGVRLARGAMADADLVLQVVDATQPLAEWPPAAGPAALRVANKIDLLAADRPVESATGERGVPVSARTGRGIDRLLAAIGERLVPAPPPAGAAVPFTGRQVEALREAEAALRAGAGRPAVVALERALC